MNYLWSGLILVSILFALAGDIHDEVTDRYQNDRIYAIDVEPINASTDRFQVADHEFTGRLSHKAGLYEIHVSGIDALPPAWREHMKRDGKEARNKTVRLPVNRFDESGRKAYLSLPPVHWRRLGNMIQAGFDMAEFAVKLALGLIGLMALWLGLMRIAQCSGGIALLVRVVRPVMKPLFPDVPQDHPAFGAIALNLSANMLGLGNAATPMGIKAMQHLQELNQDKNTASDSMCMFLALNTSSVQLLPPVTVIALMGVHASGLFVTILLTTLCSTVAAVIAALWYARRATRTK